MKTITVRYLGSDTCQYAARLQGEQEWTYFKAWDKGDAERAACYHLNIQPGQPVAFHHRYGIEHGKAG